MTRGEAQMMLQKKSLNWLWRWACVFAAVAGLAGWHDIRGSMLPAAAQWDHMILSEALILPPTIRAPIAISGDDSTPLLNRERSAVISLRGATFLTGNSETVAITTLPVAAILAMLFWIGVVPSIAALTPPFTFLYSHARSASAFLLASLLRTEGVILPQGDSAARCQMAFAVIILPLLRHLRVMHTVLLIPIMSVTSTAQSKDTPRAMLSAVLARPMFRRWASTLRLSVIGLTPSAHITCSA